MNKKGPLEDKSYKFALKVVIHCNEIIFLKKEYILTKQCIRSATSIGANVSEAQQSESRKDFISKLSIAMKESYETRYWISLLRDINKLSLGNAQIILSNLEEIIAMLGASIRTAKNNLK